MNWICAQIGAREHYAIPRVLHRDGKLGVLYTDFWASKLWRMAGRIPGKSALATRYHGDLADALVKGFNLDVLKNSLGRKKSSNPYEEFLRIGEEFGRRVVQALDARPSMLDGGSIFFSYDTGFLEPARRVKARGGKTIVCQMDPARYEVELVKEEETRWPGWARHSAEVPESYIERREEEWAVADLVMVNSEWTMQALKRQGVPADKIVIVPLAYEVPPVEGGGTKDEGFISSFRSQVSFFSPKRPLRVLFLGQAILRKGIQYLIEAAMLLRNEAIHFDIVGSIGISDEAVASAPSNMTFHGLVSRDRTDEFYRSSDLFVLPTLSDGFALTQLEAMAHGLPVIATPNCGEVVSDGVDGLIVPASDANALAEAFQLLIQDPEKLRSMSAATGPKVEKFSLGRLAENLQKLEMCLIGRSHDASACHR